MHNYPGIYRIKKDYIQFQRKYDDPADGRQGCIGNGIEPNQKTKKQDKVDLVPSMRWFYVCGKVQVL